MPERRRRRNRRQGEDAGDQRAEEEAVAIASLDMPSGETQSSIYVALPLTEWLDRVLFQRMGSNGKGAGVDKSAPAPV